MKLQVGVKVLITNSANEVLFLRRTQTVEHGGTAVWDIPGGRIDAREGLVEALTREVTEETGLVLSDSPVLLSAQDIFVTSKDLHVVRLTYRCSTDGGDIQLSDEHDEYRWLSRDEILAIENLDSYIREIL